MDLTKGIPIQRPAHRKAREDLVPGATVATWPVGTFVENVVALEDGSFVVSVESLGEVQRVQSDGSRSVVASFGASVTGLLAHGSRILVSTGAIGAEGWGVVPLGLDGAKGEAYPVPGALFLNGSAAFDGDTILIADSIRGRVYARDTATGAARVWLEHELLTKVSAEPMLPGVNGIKVVGAHLFFTNTDRALVGRVPIDAAGNPGAVEVLAEELLGDDFAVGADGSLYITTHVYNSVLRLDPAGGRTVLAGPEQGLAGATAAVFGRGPGEAGALFVTTTGGILAPYGGKVGDAKLLRLETGATAARLGWERG